ncbi:tyrosine-type recombinase/integrase [Streptomyces sp. NPDC047939]|uniref:tyrosine-type recombinase/integrase n=1 Tax=Streptomyces sp. NPDC047939 TaxID=3155381 RepID=UPI00344462C1
MERRRVKRLFKILPPEEGVGMYGFRHYFASNAFGNGIPITDVAEWMGHKSIEETYRTYRHLMPGSITKAARVLDAGLWEAVCFPDLREQQVLGLLLAHASHGRYQRKRPRFRQAAGGTEWPRPIARSGGESARKREAGRQVSTEHTSIQRATRESPGLGPRSGQPIGCCEAPEGYRVDVMAQRRARSPARGPSAGAAVPDGGRQTTPAVGAHPKIAGTPTVAVGLDDELHATVLRDRQRVRTGVARDAHPPRPLQAAALRP